MAFLDQHPGLGFPAAAGLGLLIGSFLNVVILRLPKRMEWQWRRDAREILDLPDIYEPPPPGIVVEPSHDPVTGDKLKWWENIPVLSWVMLRGKSRYSGKPISIQYPLVELLTSILCVASVWRFGFGWQGFGAIVLSCFLVVMSGIDLRHKLLPDQLTLPLMWLGLVGSMDNLYMPAKPALLGAAVGYVSLWTVWWLFKQAHRQGRDGPRRLQAAGRVGRVVRVEGHSADHPDLLAGRRHPRLDLAGGQGPRPCHPDPVRPLLGHRRLGGVLLG